MTANELRIGNKILTDDNQEVAVDISVFRALSFPNSDLWYKGIPLTEEWLLKFGAKSTELNPAKNGIWITSEIDEQGCWINISHGTGVVVIKIQYVHQLQNLYFALTGDELTIIPQEQ